MTSGKSNYRTVLKKAQTETRQRLDKALQDTAVETISRMIDRTPVDTGAAKYHWFTRALPNERFDKRRVDPSGQLPKRRAKRDIKLFKVGTIVWLVNSAPYMQFLERGSSKQAPAGFLAQTLAEVSTIFKKAIKLAFSEPV